ncbi:oligopeptidase A [Chromatiales bacterium (ex Bugula neritina AB1)]|nr:oligopeptidase A [Chromatiales bacterium (ex Bugula neritina AB1)]
MQGILDLPRFSNIDLTQIEHDLDKLLNDSNAAVAELEKVESPDWDNFVFELDLITDAIQRFFSPIRHLNSVMNSDELREVYNACLPKLSAWHTDLGQNKKLYKNFQLIAGSETFDDLSTSRRKSIDNNLRDFRLGGVALEGADKKRFKEIALELSNLGTRFQENILDATKSWQKEIIDAQALAGFPRSALDSARQSAEIRDLEGYLLTLDFPSFHAVMTFADDRDLRKEMYLAYMTRASDNGPTVNPDWDNASLIEQIIALRTEKAKLLGFPNYAEYSIASKMVESPEQVLEFIENLAGQAKPAAIKDYRQLCEFAATEYGIDALQPWDISYYSNKLKKKLFNFSEEDLKPYFPANVAIPGLFEVTGRLFGITIEKSEDADVWHKDVSLYTITDQSGTLRGAFYMDNYARSDKRGGAWMDICVGRMRKEDFIQLPVAYLTCNLTPPVGDEPALLTHNELTTLFHEFGHGLHHMLTKVDDSSVAGINGVEWDAVELPSQFLENWCWDRESLDLLGAHYETGEKLPEDLLQKARAAKNFQSGMGTVRQLEFALFDMKIHLSTDCPDSAHVQSILDGVREALAVYPIPRAVRFQNGFSHIFAGGYAAGYFSYKWAEVLSSDAFSRFEEEGIFNSDTGAQFLHCILERGGSQKALKLFSDFRGRAPQIDALLRHTGLAA